MNDNGKTQEPTQEAIAIGVILLMPDGSIAVNISNDVGDPIMLATQVVIAMANGIIQVRTQEDAKKPKIVVPKPGILRL